MDQRRQSPSVQRNRDPIADVLQRFMPTSGTILEIASGTGEHGFHFTGRFDQLVWFYSDIDREGIASQTAWRDHAPHDRLRGPLEIDVTDPDWPEGFGVQRPDAIFCANMVHISPIAAAEGLFTGAGELLAPGGRLMLYGPFSECGDMTESNQRFDADLRRRNAAWGIRDLQAEILPMAAASGLELVEQVPMPANNLSLVLVRT